MKQQPSAFSGLLCRPPLKTKRLLNKQEHRRWFMCRAAAPIAAVFCCGMGGTDAVSAVCGPGRSLPASTWLMTAPSCQPSPADLVSQYGDNIPSNNYGTN